jgi:hypothetical protein
MEIAVPEPTEQPLALFRTAEPDEIVVSATKVADALAEVIRGKNLAVTISGREHVRVEGWTLLGTMLGVFPYTVWTRKTDGGWEARVEARNAEGIAIGAAEAMCTHEEANWKERDEYALRSMAQTRATSKALRQPLGFVVSLAGYDPTPAEEMPATAFRAPAGATEETGELLTDGQRRKIYALYSNLGKAGKIAAVDSDEAQQQRSDYFGTFKISELTRAQASELIESLEAIERRP